MNTLAPPRSVRPPRDTRNRGQKVPVAPGSLWSPTALIRWGSVVGLGGVATGIAWYLASGDKHYGQQIAPIDLAVVGLVAATAANLCVLLVARRAIGIRRRAVLGEAAPRPAAPGAGSRAASPSGPVSTTIVGHPTLKQYHRSDCPMAAGKGWPMLAGDAMTGRTRCQVCEP